MTAEIQPTTTAVLVAASGTTRTVTANPVTLYGYDNDWNQTYVTNTYSTNYLYSSPVALVTVALGTGSYGGDDPTCSTDYMYDNLDRKIAGNRTYSSSGTARPTTLYSYDANGNLNWMLAPNAAAEYSYAVTNPDGSVTITWPKSTPTEATIYRYDLLGRQTAVTQPQVATPTGNNHSYHHLYDAVGNVLAVTNALGLYYPLPVRCGKPQDRGDRSGLRRRQRQRRHTHYHLYLRRQWQPALDHRPRRQHHPLPVRRPESPGGPHRRPGQRHPDGLRSLRQRGRGHRRPWAAPPVRLRQPGTQNEEIDPIRLTPAISARTRGPTTYYGYDADGNLKYVTDPRLRPQPPVR